MQVEPGRGLVFRGAVPVRDSPAPYDFTWSFAVRDGTGGSTRLVVRERYAYLHRSAVLLVETVSVISWFMSQRMLRSIKERAEELSRRS